MDISPWRQITPYQLYHVDIGINTLPGLLSIYNHKLHDRTYPYIVSTHPELTHDSQDEVVGLLIVNCL